MNLFISAESLLDLNGQQTNFTNLCCHIGCFFHSYVQYNFNSKFKSPWEPSVHNSMCGTTLSWLSGPSCLASNEFHKTSHKAESHYIHFPLILCFIITKCNLKFYILFNVEIKPLNFFSSGAIQYIDGLVQEIHNSIVKALELHLSCANPSVLYLSGFCCCFSCFVCQCVFVESVVVKINSCLPGGNVYFNGLAWTEWPPKCWCRFRELSISWSLESTNYELWCTLQHLHDAMILSHFFYKDQFSSWVAYCPISDVLCWHAWWCCFFLVHRLQLWFV